MRVVLIASLLLCFAGCQANNMPRVKLSAHYTDIRITYDTATNTVELAQDMQGDTIRK